MKDDTSSGATPAPSTTVGADTAVATSQPATTPHSQDVRQQVQQPQPQTSVSPLTQQVVFFYIPILCWKISVHCRIGICRNLHTKLRLKCSPIL
jgi:hypothetical protein